MPLKTNHLGIALLAIFIAVLNACSNKVVHQDVIPRHDSFTIESSKVGETRVIAVWTPPEYPGGEVHYPVLYMPDGGVKEDFPHVAQTLSKLIEAKSIPPMILVGIENTERGRDLTGFSDTEYDAQFCPQTDGAKNFRAFIIEELIPEINEKYRTTDRRAIIGESLAGLFVMETFFLSPEAFDQYIAFDPSLWWNDHFLVRNAEDLLAEKTDHNNQLWFAGSSAKDISEHTRALSDKFENLQPAGLTWKYSDQPKEKHHTIFRASKEMALIWTFGENN